VSPLKIWHRDIAGDNPVVSDLLIRHFQTRQMKPSSCLFDGLAFITNPPEFRMQ